MSALETAVYEFAKNPLIEALSKPISERIDVNRLGAQSEHLGFSGTVRYLLPIVLTEDQVPTTVFSACSDAIDDRNKLVHAKQRDVPQEVAIRWLGAIRALCELLASITDSSE
ncbi:MAG: hypothetical protein HC869_05240 [Rhodospirillales bacterium]|nr:hypothetical protein [Rhodospirillales bacterium]